MAQRLRGAEFVVSDLATHQEWIFPKDPFVEFGPEDEWWAIKYGFGRWSAPQPAIYKVGGHREVDRYFIHPAMMDALKKSGLVV